MFQTRDHAPIWCSPNIRSTKLSTTIPARIIDVQVRPQNDRSILITMLSTVPLNAGRRRVFGSVFSPASLEARPPFASTFEHDQTPFASFQSSTSSSTIKTGSQAISFATAPQEPPADREAWDQAWSAATAFLAVPDLGFAPIYESRETDGSEALKQWNRLSPPSKETGEALAYLTAATRHTNTQDLFGWYADEIRRHFLTNLRSGLYEVRRKVYIADAEPRLMMCTASEERREGWPTADDRQLSPTGPPYLPGPCRALPIAAASHI